MLVRYGTKCACNNKIVFYAEVKLKTSFICTQWFCTAIVIIALCSSPYKTSSTWTSAVAKIDSVLCLSYVQQFL